MVIAFEIALWVLAVSISIPMLTFVFEVLLSLPGSTKEDEKAERSDSRANFAVIVPAHNEEQEIGSTLAALKVEVDEPSCILVVADNCSDSTVEIAHAAGVSVLERHDDQNRGKGFALAAGVIALTENPPEIVVFVDADCRPDRGALTALNAQVIRSGRPAQAVNLLEPPGSDVRQAISWLAMTFKNMVRPRGLARLGGPCLLTGTGFALPWSLIEHVTRGTADIVEDMRLGIDLALAGDAPRRCPEARVVSPMAPSDASASTQRTRWEHGHLQTMLKQVPRLLIGFVTRRDPKLLLMALDLAVPPLSLLVMSWLVTLLISAVGLPWDIEGPVLWLLIAGVLLGIAVGGGWYRFARLEISPRLLLFIPVYLVWKIPIYTRFPFQRERSWIRTERVR